jgi:hypothetical protein
MRSINKWLAEAGCIVLLFAAACGGGSSSHNNSTAPPPTGSNVQPITVYSGPAGNYGNGAFTSVTVCMPSSSNCETIDGILVDTGSTGLRILSSALTLSLPQQMSSGNPVLECYAFVSGYTWGYVETAGIQISGEQASSAAIQVIGGSTPDAPTQCSSMSPTPSNNQQSLGANGILGVGQFAQDCGQNCPASTNMYWECPSSGCVAISQPVTQQLQNPVTLFATDNNGVIIELPAATTPQLSMNGSLVFGIGTESNNALDGATVYQVNQNAFISTVFNGTTYAQSFLDSGSNGIYFLNTTETGIPICSDDNSFYCPASTANLSATNQGSNGTSEQVNFSVANADDMFSSSPSGTAVFPNLAGPNSAFSGFDWGLPFFYGRNVYTGIETATAAPYWAF